MIQWAGWAMAMALATYIMVNNHSNNNPGVSDGSSPNAPYPVYYEKKSNHENVPAYEGLSWNASHITSVLKSKVPAAGVRRAVVLSFYKSPNFGDRIGALMVAQVLPAGISVHHCYFSFCENSKERYCPYSCGKPTDYDVAIIGVGMSLWGRTFQPELNSFVEPIPVVIGLFGTQYRSTITPDNINPLLAQVDVWFARYKDDVELYGDLLGERAVHLGDWVIDFCPMKDWTSHIVFQAQPLIQTIEVAIDRFIEQLQSARVVDSYRLHPLLCALGSAERVVYHEQSTEGSSGETSGKFHSMLMDVFGHVPPQETIFTVDRAAVAAYKRMVQRNVRTMAQVLSDALQPIATTRSEDSPMYFEVDSEAETVGPFNNFRAPHKQYWSMEDRRQCILQMDKSKEMLREAGVPEIAELEKYLEEHPACGPLHATLSLLKGKIGLTTESAAEVETMLQNAFSLAETMGQRMDACQIMQSLARDLKKPKLAAQFKASKFCGE